MQYMPRKPSCVLSLSLLLACLSAGLPSGGLARTLPRKVPAHVLMRQSDIVVVGVVVGVVQDVSRIKPEAVQIGYEYSEIKILTALKGDEAGTILVWNKTINSEADSGCCVAGAEYVLFLSRAADGNYFVNGGRQGAVPVPSH